MMETAAFSPVAVTAASDHVTFRAADGSIYGIGKHANHHSYSAEPEREALRKIELPDGVSPSEIQKVCEAKFARGVWLKDGRFFFELSGFFASSFFLVVILRERPSKAKKGRSLLRQKRPPWR